MADRDDPLAVRWLVGVELTKFRERAGKKIGQAAKVINCSPGKIGHMESGRNQQQPSEVRDLLRFYSADQADIDRLASLAGSAGEQTWWAPWTDVVPDWLRTFVGLEGLAARSSIYAPLVFPALLQTENYALGATAGNIRVRPDHNERTVNMRMERQRRVFDEAEPLQLTVMLEEVALIDPSAGRTSSARSWSMSWTSWSATTSTFECCRPPSAHTTAWSVRSRCSTSRRPRASPTSSWSTGRSMSRIKIR